MTNPKAAPATQPKDCRCGHTKGAHYNGLGVCRMEGGTGHICRCNRYCPAVYEEPIVPENPNSDKHHVAAKEQLQYEPKAPAPDMENCAHPIEIYEAGNIYCKDCHIWLSSGPSDAAPDMEQAVREVPSKKPCPDCFVYPDGSFRCDMNCGPSIPVQPDPLGIEAALRMTRGHLKLSQPTSKLPQHPESVMETAETAPTLQDYWRCFHCDFATSNRAEAEAHFGDRDDAEEFKPICKWWQLMSEDERIGALQDTIQQLNEAHQEAIAVCPKCNRPHYNMEDSAACAAESVLDVQGGGFEEWWKREGPEWSDARLIEPYAKSAWHAALATLAAASAKLTGAQQAASPLNPSMSRICENCEQPFAHHRHRNDGFYCHETGEGLFRHVHPSALPDPAAVSGEATTCTHYCSIADTDKYCCDAKCGMPCPDCPDASHQNPSPLAAFEQVRQFMACPAPVGWGAVKVVLASDYDSLLAYAKGLQEQLDRLK